MPRGSYRVDRVSHPLRRTTWADRGSPLFLSFLLLSTAPGPFVWYSMQEEALQRLREQLLGMQEELKALDATSKASTKPVELDQARMGRLSRMDAMQDQQMAQEAARRNQQMLVRIEGALRRIDAGRFGDCFMCGEEIDLRRLEFDPTSTRCIACAEK